jgi:hypothetical protein
MSEKTAPSNIQEARRDFVVGVVPLSLWLARRLWREGMDLAETLTARTNLYRLTCLWDGRNHPARPVDGWRDPRWDELLGQMRALFEGHAGSDETTALEREGLALLWPVLEPRLEVDSRVSPTPRPRPFGFFTYDYSAEQRSVTLHLANPCPPRSPFAEPAARAAELGRLLDEATARDPAPLRVRCGSWLNSFPPFHAFFPPTWAASASEPTPLAYHYGWWGQFIDRTGGFHRRNGAHLRQTGQFPYPCVNCACSVSELSAHLAQQFAVHSSLSQA